MLLRHSPNNVCYSRIVRSASIPNNIQAGLKCHEFLQISVASIIGALDVIERRWREWRTAHDANPQRGISQVSETDIVAIRLLMTNGSRHTFEEWLTHPDRLKHYIDMFNQPSSSIQPLQASFVQRNGEALRVDVSRGAQNNLQLDELLSYLHINSAEK